MRFLFFIFLFSAFANAQVSNIYEDPLKEYGALPNYWNGWNNYEALPEATHYDDGFRNLVYPIYGQNEKLGALVYNSDLDVVTFQVLQKSDQEIEIEMRLQVESARRAALETYQIAQLEAVVENMSDEDALEHTDLFPFWKPGEYVTAGTKRQHFSPDMSEVWLWKLNNHDHTTIEGWEPRNMQYAWVRVGFPDEVLKWVQPHAHNPYMTGDKVWYTEVGEVKYISTIDNNVHAPGIVPGAWETVD